MNRTTGMILSYDLIGAVHRPQICALVIPERPPRCPTDIEEACRDVRFVPKADSALQQRASYSGKWARFRRLGCIVLKSSLHSAHIDSHKELTP
jgi:hypothetical protein